MRRLPILLALSCTSFIFTLAFCEVLARFLVPPIPFVEVTNYQERAGSMKEKAVKDQTHGIDVVLQFGGEQGVRLTPNVTARVHDHSLSHQDVAIEANSLGVRYEELPEKAPDEFRVLMVGDSITFGDYLNASDTIPILLENSLQGRGKKIRVINAGLPGASTSEELYHYLELRNAIKPDLVLIGMYLNDAQNSKIFRSRAVPYPWSKSRLLTWLLPRIDLLRATLLSKWVALSDTDPTWREKFRGERTLKSGDMLNTRDGYDYEIYNAYLDFGLAWNPASWEKIKAIMESFSSEVNRVGEKLAVVLFPVHFQVKASSEIEKFVPQESFLTMCKDLGLSCFDSLPILRDEWKKNQKDLFYDHCHFRKDGNILMAHAVKEWLDTEKLLPQ